MLRKDFNLIATIAGFINSNRQRGRRGGIRDKVGEWVRKTGMKHVREYLAEISEVYISQCEASLEEAIGRGNSIFNSDPVRCSCLISTGLTRCVYQPFSGVLYQSIHLPPKVCFSVFESPIK